jgi:tetratricopeptide (TPR) repeat protein
MQAGAELFPDWDAAIAKFKEGLHDIESMPQGEKKNLGLAALYSSLGTAFGAKGDFDKALDSYRRAKSLAEDSEPDVSIAMLYAEQRRFKEAEEFLHLAQENPLNEPLNIHGIYAKFGIIELLKGNILGALDYLRRSRKIAETIKDMPTCFFDTQLAERLIDAGIHEEPIDYLQYVLSRDPKNLRVIELLRKAVSKRKGSQKNKK